MVCDYAKSLKKVSLIVTLCWYNIQEGWKLYVQYYGTEFKSRLFVSNMENILVSVVLCVFAALKCECSQVKMEKMYFEGHTKEH